MKCVLRYTDFMFDRSRKNQKLRVPEYTFSLLPRNLVHFGFCTNLVRFRFSILNKLFARGLSGLKARGSGLRAQGSGLRAQGSKFRFGIWGFGLRVPGFGSEVLGNI